jgi:2'-5' RNA ligase
VSAAGRLSLWLLPEAGAAARLARVIDELARSAGTPAFSPHLTLLGSVPITDAAARAERLGRVLAALGPLELAVVGPVVTDEPFRALVLEVRRDPPLVAAHARACERFEVAPEQPFFPHLSLLYGEVPADEKARFLDEVVGPAALPRTVGCDRLELHDTSGEVAGWRARGTFGLTAGGPSGGRRPSPGRG